MKRILTAFLLLFSLATLAQQNNATFNRVIARDSIYVPGGWITGLSSDSAMSSSSAGIVPYQSAVKKALMGVVDNYPVDTLSTINALIAYTGKAKLLVVNDSLRGDQFKYIPGPNAPPVDSGITFPATGRGGGVYQRQWDHSVIKASWFGVLPGLADASRGLNRAIEFHAPVSILLSAGTYRLKNIVVPAGVKIYAEQIAKNIVPAEVPTKILPAAGASTIFDFTEDAHNSQLDNLYIDGDYTNNPNLFAAVRFKGTDNWLTHNNFVNFPNHVVYMTAGRSYVVFNNFQGMFAHNLPFSGPEDFHGVLHIPASGDDYIQFNEVGAAAPYLTGQVPDPSQILRDPTYKRIVALYGGYLGNSYVTNNLFENADQGAVINGAFVGHYEGNRYEMNAFRGLRLRFVYNSTFKAEHFTNNSLALNGQGEDIRLDTGAVGFCTFDGLTFTRAVHPFIPTSSYKVKFNIVNYSGAGGNTFITPSFSDTSAAARYDSLGHYDNTIAANPLRIVEGQYDPKNVAYNSVIAGGDGNKDPYTNWQFLGGVKLNPGTTTGGGNYTGSVAFFDASNTVKSSIGLDAGNDLTFNLFTSSGRYNFNNGEGFFNKNGAAGVTIQSNDGLGNPYLNFISGAKSAGFTLDRTTGDLSALASGGLTFTSGNGNPFTVINAGMSIAKAAGPILNLLSNSTGTSYIQMSSDALAANLFKIAFDNTNGNTIISSTGSVTMGNNNMLFASNGLTYIPTLPSPAGGDTTFDFLGRDHISGKIVYKSNVYWDSTTIKNRTITSINGLTGPAISVATGTTGTDVNVTNASNTVTVNIPDASATARGALTSGTQIIGGQKTFSTGIILSTVTNNLYLPTSSALSAVTNTQFTFGGATSIYGRVMMGASAATTLGVGSAFGNIIAGKATFTTAATGTHSFGGNLVVLPTIKSSGSAPVTVLANLLVLGTSVGGTNNYNTYLDSGNVAVVPTLGNMGVGTATPTSKFHSVGSAAYDNASTGTNLTLGEHNILRVTTSGITLTLPTASTCNGRVYEIRNEAAGTLTITSVLIDGVGTTTFPANTYWKIYSDGTNWRLLSRSN